MLSSPPAGQGAGDFAACTQADLEATCVGAVRALYGTDARARAEANSWLVALAAAPQAWAVAAALVAYEATEVRAPSTPLSGQRQLRFAPPRLTCAPLHARRFRRCATSCPTSC